MGERAVAYPRPRSSPLSQALRAGRPMFNSCALEGSLEPASDKELMFEEREGQALCGAADFR